MDGTLVNSDDAVEAAWVAWARANGVEAADVLAVCHGSDVATTVRRFLPGIGEVELAEHVAAHLERECADTDGVRPAPGALELIAWMDDRALPWAVVTNAHPRLARARLGAAGLDPPVIVSRDDVERGKPHPEGYLLGARRLGVEPRCAAAVEDSAPGLAAARAAGWSSWLWAELRMATSCAATWMNCVACWPRPGGGRHEDHGGAGRPVRVA